MAGGVGQNAAPAPIIQFLIQVYGEEREALMQHAISHGYGVEVADFYLPELLDNEARCTALVSWYRERLSSVQGMIAFHGAFLDLRGSARDPRIVGVTRARVDHCMDIAECLGATCAIFHSDFNASIRHPAYPPGWLQRQAAFWRDAMTNRRVQLLLENLWEPTPELLRDAAGQIGLDSVGACLDTGHAHLYSQVPLGDWVDVLAERIRYLHLSDNDGSYDQHLSPGRGTIDWTSFADALRRGNRSLPVVPETETLDRVQETVGALTRLGLLRPAP